MDFMSSIQFADTTNIIPDLVPKLIEAGDITLAHLFIDLNSQTRQVYETTMRMMESDDLEAFNFGTMHDHLAQQAQLLKDALELQVMLIERHPELALWVFKEASLQQMREL